VLFVFSLGMFLAALIFHQIGFLIFNLNYIKKSPLFEGFIYLIYLTMTFCKIIHKVNNACTPSNGTAL
jgi:hypothetical protein